MSKRLAASLGAIGIAAVGVMAFPSASSASVGDIHSKATTCSDGTSITLRVKDTGDSPQRLSTRVVLNGDAASAQWTVRTYQHGDLTSKTWQRADGSGNLTTYAAFSGDEQDKTKVTAEAANGEECTVGFTLND
jgi:hypothetical protein